MNGISFVIPNYNGRNLLEKYLPSLLREADLSRDEIIIVDDHSADASVEFLRNNFPQVKVLELKKNMGFAYAADYGVYHSRNRLVCVLNTDVEVIPGFTGPLVKHFSRPEVFAVSSMQLPVDGKPATYALPAARMFLGVFLYRYQSLRAAPADAAEILFTQGAATVYDKNKFTALGGFDKMYRPIYWEDLDLGYRAWKKGWVSLYEPQSTHRHYIMGTTRGMFNPLYKRVFHWKNRILFTWRNIDSPVLLMEEILFLPFSLFLFPLAGKPEFTLGFLYALLQLPEVIDRKLRDKGSRIIPDRAILKKFSPEAVKKTPVRGKINILYLHETSFIAGAENSLLNLARNLDRDKFQPLFVLPEEGPLAEELRKLDIGVEFADFPRVRSLRGVIQAVRRIVLIIRENNISLIHSNSIRTHIYAAVAGKISGVPCVWHQRNMLQNEIIDPDRLLAFLADGIICNSSAIAGRFRRFGRLPGKVSVVFNGVDIRKFSPDADGRGIREELGIKPGELVVGIASRFNRQKGHETFLRAAQEIVIQYPEKAAGMKFLIAGGSVFPGDKPREEYLRKMVSRLKLEDKVVFAGYRRDMPRVYAAMDIFVLASSAEACGRVVLEAMAGAKPVIATASGGTPEMITDGRDGYLFKFGDYRDLAEKIVYLNDNPAAAKSLAAAARKKIEDKFTIETNVSKIQGIYRETISF